MLDVHLLDSLVAGAMVFLCLALVALGAVAMTLIPQATRTLTAAEKLLLTLTDEIPPTLEQVNMLMVDVRDMKLLAKTKVEEVKTTVEDVTENLTDNVSKAADTAKKHTSVWGAGLIAGARAYLEGKGDSHKH